MVAIRANDLELTYRFRRQLALARFDRRMSAVSRLPHPHGRIVNRDGKRSVEALRGVSFALEAGDRLGLVGSNGAGKTTLLKVLYGIYEPTAGSVTTHGRVDALFNINLGFRREATGRRNVELRGLINGWDRDEIARRMDEIIAFSELEDFIDMPFKAYSQGMAARLAFAVATSLDPEILLMDEWIGAGDRQFQQKARARMEEIAERAGIIVLASHNDALLKRVCTKILHLENGVVKSFGSAEEYFAEEQPAD